MPRVNIRDEYNQYTVEFPDEHRVISRQRLEKFFRNLEWNFRARQDQRRPGQGVLQVMIDGENYTAFRNLCGLQGGYLRRSVKKSSRKFKKSARRNNYARNI